jgi:hypothetical protein
MKQNKTKIGLAILAVILAAILLTVSYATIECFVSLNTLPDSVLQTNLVMHCRVYQYRNGLLISYTNHVMTKTTFYLNWLEDNIANSAGANVTLFAKHIGVSNCSNAVGASDTNLTAEITDGGLARKAGVFQNLGTGHWFLNATYSVSATRDSQSYGLYLDSYANWDLGGLVAAEHQGVIKHLVAGDTLIVSIEGTVT